MSGVRVFLDPISPHFAEDRLFEQHPHGDFHAPYMRVQEVFREYGIDVHTADFLLNGRYTADQNVYFALGNVSNYKKVAVRDDSILSGLFHLEAPIIHPSTYRATREASAYFSRVYSFTTPDALEPFDCAGLAL